MKIGIYGGTFNPVHIGHVRLLQSFSKWLQLDLTIVVPTRIPPHKSSFMLADAAKRLEMCHIAFDAPNVLVSDIELKRPGKSYSVDTVTQLKQQYPGADFYFLMGSDMFLSLESWHRYDDLKQMVTFCATAREEDEFGRLRACSRKLQEGGAKTCVADFKVTPVSSSQIREKVLYHEPFEQLVPEGISSWISENGLYSFEKTVQSFSGVVRAHLEDQRFHHSLCVAEAAADLARKNNANPYKAYVAGLLHDVMKQTEEQEQLQFIKKSGILFADIEFSSKALLHAVGGCAFVYENLGLRDRDLLNAIRYHTTSRPGASLLEDILYVADFISADRDYPDVDVIRQKAQADLKDAKLYGLSYTISDNVGKQRKIGINTIEAYNSLL